MQLTTLLNEVLVDLTLLRTLSIGFEITTGWYFFTEDVRFDSSLLGFETLLETSQHGNCLYNENRIKKHRLYVFL